MNNLELKRRCSSLMKCFPQGNIVFFILEAIENNDMISKTDEEIEKVVVEIEKWKSGEKFDFLPVLELAFIAGFQKGLVIGELNNAIKRCLEDSGKKYEKAMKEVLSKSGLSSDEYETLMLTMAQEYSRVKGSKEKTRITCAKEAGHRYLDGIDKKLSDDTLLRYFKNAKNACANEKRFVPNSISVLFE